MRNNFNLDKYLKTISKQETIFESKSKRVVYQDRETSETVLSEIVVQKGNLGTGENEKTFFVKGAVSITLDELCSIVGNTFSKMTSKQIEIMVQTMNDALAVAKIKKSQEIDSAKQALLDRIALLEEEAKALS